jgi:SH3-domain binding protein 5
MTTTNGENPIDLENNETVESDDHLGRVQEELDTMNYSNESINNLELELEDSKRELERSTINMRNDLEQLEMKLGQCVDKSRPYYQQLAITNESKEKYLKAKHRFETAQELYVAAKRLQMYADENLEKAKTVGEQYQMKKMSETARMKVIDAEVEKQTSDIEQITAYSVYVTHSTHLDKLAKSLKKSLDKSKEYFDTQNELQKELNFLKTKVDGLRNCLFEAKHLYHQSMKNLEIISTEIHRKRTLLNTNNQKETKELQLNDNNETKITTTTTTTVTSSGSATIKNENEFSCKCKFKHNSNL